MGTFGLAVGCLGLAGGPAYLAWWPFRLDRQLLADLSSGAGEPRGGSIWRDPHVQRQLLAVHLDDSTAAATRSPQAVRRTIELLTAGLAPGASVLDLGCGPGRYTRQLADDGFDVTGVDFNRASIEYARRTSGDISATSRPTTPGPARGPVRPCDPHLLGLRHAPTRRAARPAPRRLQAVAARWSTGARLPGCEGDRPTSAVPRLGGVGNRAGSGRLVPTWCSSRRPSIPWCWHSGSGTRC